MVNLRKVTSSLLISLFVLFMFSFARSKILANTASNTVCVSPGQSIQEAIDNASAGATIFLANGTYQEHLNINKSLTIVGEDRDTTIIDGQDADYVVSITGENVTIRGLTIMKSVPKFNDGGIRLEGGRGIAVSNTKIANTYTGITLFAFSANNVFSGNLILDNAYGIVILSSNYNVFSNNVVSNNSAEGIALYSSNNNIFFGNTFSGNGEAAFLSRYTNRNLFFHNNILDLIRVESGSLNIWSRYGEGNYWGMPIGQDLDDNGIGDEPYLIDDSNQDDSPLMGTFSEFSIVLNGQTFSVTVISNSTISDFRFEIGRETGNKMINFNGVGPNGTNGFCRMLIPTSLMGYPLSVIDGRGELAAKLLAVSNQTNAYLYFTYAHDDESLTVLSSKTSQLYNELLEKYAEVMMDLENLNSSFQSLLANYTSRLQTDIDGLNATCQTVLSSLSLILESLNQLKNSYTALNSSLQQSLINQSDSMQNIRNLTYVFAATTAALLITTVYLSNRVHANNKPKKYASEKQE